jgi:hypothetical protein
MGYDVAITTLFEADGGYGVRKAFSLSAGQGKYAFLNSCTPCLNLAEPKEEDHGY